MNNSLATIRRDGRTRLGVLGGSLGSAPIACEPASGCLGAILVGLGALSDNPRRVSKSTLRVPCLILRPLSGKHTKWKLPYGC